MKRPFLCWLGFHKDRDLWRYPPERLGQTVITKCLRCGREDTFHAVTVFSGPRSGPMHPDAEPGAENGRSTVR